MLAGRIRDFTDSAALPPDETTILEAISTDRFPTNAAEAPECTHPRFRYRGGSDHVVFADHLDHFRTLH